MRSADDPRPVITEFARRLDARHIPLRQFGIQFIQIGDDEEATLALRELHDDLGLARGNRVRKYEPVLMKLIR